MSSRAALSSPGTMSSPTLSSSPLNPLPLPAPAETKKTTLFIGAGTVAALALGGFLLFGGSSPAAMVVSVAGPGGKAVPAVKVLLDGEVKCEDSPCKIAELEPGSYVIKAVAPGYAEMAGQAHQLASGEEKAINIELLPGAATGVKVSAPATGLSLTIDGKKMGALPQDLIELGPGSHKIEVSGSEFFDAYETNITVKEGEVANIDPDLKLKKGQVTVKLGNNADDAKVFLLVDGKRRPLDRIVEKGAPLILPVDGKRYEIVATKRGYEDFEQALEFTLNEPVKTVTISMDEEGDGSDEAEERSSAPVSSPRERSAPATAPASRPAPSAAPAVSGTGTLNINSIPVSNVILDGRPLGTTPKIGVSVSAGPHTVVFVHKEHGRKTSSVNVKPGSVATAAVRFP